MNKRTLIALIPLFTLVGLVIVGVLFGNEILTKYRMWKLNSLHAEIFGEDETMAEIGAAANQGVRKRSYLIENYIAIRESLVQSGEFTLLEFDIPKVRDREDTKSGNARKKFIKDFGAISNQYPHRVLGKDGEFTVFAPNDSADQWKTAIEKIISELDPTLDASNPFGEMPAPDEQQL